MRFYLNTLSADRQVFTDIDPVMRSLIECLRPIREALRARRAELRVDELIYTRALCATSQGLLECINRIRDGGLRTEWYMFTKSLAFIEGDSQKSTMIAAAGSNIVGEAAETMLSAPALIGFSGRQILEETLIDVSHIGDATVRSIPSLCFVDRLWQFIPKYELNPKHRRDSYVRDGGEFVARMSIDDARAQELLLIAVDYGAYKYAKERDIYLKFAPTETRGGVSIFHAYEVEQTEIPNQVLHALA